MSISSEIRRPEIETMSSGDLVVSSLTIAQGAEVDHRAVLQLIDKHQVKIDQFGQTAFEMRSGEVRPQGGTGRPTRVALLNEPQSTLLMTFMRNTERVIDFKVALVKAFYEMAQQAASKFDPATLTRTQILTMALEAEQRNQELAARIEADAPKVTYVDTFVADEDLITIRTLASDLRIGEGALRELLISKRWIYRQSASRWSNKEGRKVVVHRYSAMADKKDYFQAVMNHEAPRFKDEVMHTLKVTSVGAAAITGLVTRIRTDRALLSENELTA